jgi:hypothetical protein
MTSVQRTSIVYNNPNKIIGIKHTKNKIKFFSIVEPDIFEKENTINNIKITIIPLKTEP